MSAPDDATLRAILDGLRRGSVWITADRCQGDSVAVNAFCDLVRAAPALLHEVLRLRDEGLAIGNLLAVIHRDGGHHMAEHGVEASCAAAERVVCDDRARLDAVEHAARAYRDATEVLIGAWTVRDGTRADSDAAGYLADHSAALLDLGAVRDAARAHLAADDALSLARRTDAADVTRVLLAEARADAARECLAGLVGYAGEVGR